MKVAVVGYGRMGRLIKAIAEERGHTVCTIDPETPGADFRGISHEALQGVEVCIDFSRPEAALPNIHAISSLGKSMVVGTTGWYDQLDDVRRLVQERRIGFMYSANFSIGVNAFMHVVRAAAAIFDRLDAYDVAGIEYHHRKKADSPSGTARALGEQLLEGISRKQRLVYDIVNRPIEPDELHFASVRCGAIPGTHEVLFDSEADTISLRHTARGRHGFAYGAVVAAEWMSGRQGFFTIDDMLGTLLGKE